jgi:hypothetical protein
MGSIFTRLGAVGLVTDSAVRDIPEVRALGFRYFAAGAVASHANFRIVRVGVPVQVRGVVFQPGDIVHGDENGVLQVPREALPTLPAHTRSHPLPRTGIAGLRPSRRFHPRRTRRKDCRVRQGILPALVTPFDGAGRFQETPFRP